MQVTIHSQHWNSQTIQCFFQTAIQVDPVLLLHDATKLAPDRVAPSENHTWWPCERHESEGAYFYVGEIFPSWFRTFTKGYQRWDSGQYD